MRLCTVFVQRSIVIIFITNYRNEYKLFRNYLCLQTHYRKNIFSFQSYFFFSLFSLQAFVQKKYPGFSCSILYGRNRKIRDIFQKSWYQPQSSSARCSSRILSAIRAINSELVGFPFPALTVYPNNSSIISIFPRDHATSIA